MTPSLATMYLNLSIGVAAGKGGERGIEVVLRYVAASIAGQSDIRQQQLSQGHIGDISKQARLATSCFSVDEQGVIRDSRLVLS